MSDAAFLLACLRDRRLAPLAASPLPAWLWSADATRILWANAVGAAIFGASACAAIGARKFDTGQPAAAQIAQLSTTLPDSGAEQAQRLRGFGAGVGRALTCNCSRYALADGTSAILVVATERAGPDLALEERVRRLIAGCDAPLAAFAADGSLIDATPAAHDALAGTTSLFALGGGSLAGEALRNGHAEADTAKGALAIDRIGPGPILVLALGPRRVEQTQPAADVPEALAAPIAILPAPPEPPALRAVDTPEEPPPALAVVEMPPAAAPEEPAEAALPAPAPAAIAQSAPVPDAAAAAPPAATSFSAAPPPVPAASERRHPLRFVWQMDEAGRFTLGSEEFGALMGPRTAAVLGRAWPEIARELRLDPDGRIAQAIATHDTWSGITMAWPADDGGAPLAIELSGLPIFDRERAFRGYRGFGVCRDLARLAALRARRTGLPEPPAAEAVASQTAAVPAAENILPFPVPPAEGHAPTLSPGERHAFHELSRTLAQRLTLAATGPGRGAAPAHEAAGIARAAGETAAAAAPPGAAAPDPPLIAAEGDEADATAPAALRAEPPSAPSQTKIATQLAARDARPMFDKLPVGVLIYRLDHLLYANPAFLRWSGHDSLANLVNAGGLDSLFVEPATADEEPEDGAPLALTVDRGDQNPIKAELIAVEWEGEGAHALVAAGLAVEPPAPQTHLDEARAEIAELRAVLDTATDGVLVLTRAGNILSANRGAETLFGRDAQALGGASLLDLIAPESLDHASDYLESVAREGLAAATGGPREIAGRGRDGAPLALLMTLGPIGAPADKLCAVFRDIGRWKTTEAELIAARRQAEQASSAKSDLLAKISHEIRTPLNAIIGFSEVMMEERFGPVGNERYRDYLRDIHVSGGHLISLINDLLDLSKIEAGKLELTFANVALNDLTQQCVAIMQPQANRDRIIIRTSLPPTLPQVVADARSVRQIVLNLLSNSIKFTGAGGHVIVSTALNDNGEVVLRVRDTGIGMSEQDLAVAMQPFRQLATSARGAGTGLGLPLTKALAEANRASFNIKSTPNSGTLVEVAFPSSRVLAG